MRGGQWSGEVQVRVMDWCALRLVVGAEAWVKRLKFCASLDGERGKA